MGWSNCQIRRIGTGSQEMVNLFDYPDRVCLKRGQVPWRQQDNCSHYRHDTRCKGQCLFLNACYRLTDADHEANGETDNYDRRDQQQRSQHQVSTDHDRFTHIHFSSPRKALSFLIRFGPGGDLGPWLVLVFGVRVHQLSRQRNVVDRVQDFGNRSLIECVK